MQDFDLYTGKPGHSYTPRFDTVDPDYFTRMNDISSKDEIRSRRKTSRIIAFVGGLCIAAFTAGLVVGIKFAGGSDKELVDPHTFQAMSTLGQHVTSLGDGQTEQSHAPINGNKSEQTLVKNTYPKAEYPFVIRVGNEYSKEKAGDVASSLNGKGHIMIIAKSDTGYRVYAGPFKTMDSAEISLQKIRGYSDNRWQNAVVLKR
jgi:hypothetical protein